MVVLLPNLFDYIRNGKAREDCVSGVRNAGMLLRKRYA